MSHILVFTTVPNEELAQKIADRLLGENLAACVSAAPIISNYKWQGVTQKSSELELKIKTKTKKYKKVERLIRSLHTYELPEILAVGVEKGSGEYLKWIDKSLKADR